MAVRKTALKALRGRVYAREKKYLRRWKAASKKGKTLVKGSEEQRKNARTRVWNREHYKASRKRRRALDQRIARLPKELDYRALKHVVPNLTTSQAKMHARALAPAFAENKINTPRRAAAAVAQFAHESAGMRTTTEYADGSAYEWRRDLGNIFAGDGRRFRGRGYIQVTGRNNYSWATRTFKYNFLNNPFALAKPKWAAKVSARWWRDHGCNELADKGDFVALTRRINGGTNGLADRQAYHARARQVADRLVPR